MRIGVLAMQGDFREHRAMLGRCGAESIEVRRPADLHAIDGLIIPGGESTTISHLLQEGGLFEGLRERILAGLPVYGTCAGAILLAKEVVGRAPCTLAVMDITVRRNAYGRQVDSFEADIEVPALGPDPVRAVFIRAPYIERVGQGVEVLGSYGGRPVLVRQDNCLVSTFHPELTLDTRLHRYFLSMVLAREQS